MRIAIDVLNQIITKAVRIELEELPKEIDGDNLLMLAMFGAGIKFNILSMLKEWDDKEAQGEWLWVGDNPKHKWSCSRCGRAVKAQENFCPQCGLRMKGGAE